MSECLFCQIVAGKIPCTEVHNDENFLAFRDISPQAPTHILVIPKRHISALSELAELHRLPLPPSAIIATAFTCFVDTTAGTNRHTVEGRYGRSAAAAPRWHTASAVTVLVHQAVVAIG